MVVIAPDHTQCPWVTHTDECSHRGYYSCHSYWATLHRMDPFQREFRRSLHNVGRFLTRQGVAP